MGTNRAGGTPTAHNLCSTGSGRVRPLRDREIICKDKRKRGWVNEPLFSELVEMTLLQELRQGGFWVLKAAVLLQVLIVPWETRRGRAGYRPIWDPPDERLDPSIDIVLLLGTFLGTLLCFVVWHVVSRGSRGVGVDGARSGDG